MAQLDDLAEFGFEPINEEELQEFGFEPVADTQEAPQLEEKPSIPASAAKSAMIGGTIYAGQKGLENKIAKAGGLQDLGASILEKIGPLEKRQVKAILKDPKAYRAAPELGELIQEYNALSEKIRGRGLNAAEMAEDILSAQDIEVPRASLEQSLAKQVETRALPLNLQAVRKEAEKATELLNNAKNVQKRVITSYIQRGQEVPEDIAKKMNTEIAKLESKANSAIDNLNKISKRQLPKNIRKYTSENIQAPSSLERAIRTEAEILQSMPEKVRGEYLSSLLKEYRSQAEYGPGVQGKSAFYRDVGESVRDIIGQESPEFDQLKKISKSSMEQEAKLKKILNLQQPVDKSLPLEASNTTKSKLMGMFAPGSEGHLVSKNELKKVLELENVGDLFDKSELSVIKKFIDRGGVDLLDVVSIGSAAKTPYLLVKLVALTRFINKFGGKIQSGAAQALGSPIVKGAGKAAWKSLPVLGALGTYAESQAEGESPELSALKTGLDVATDVIPGIGQVKAALEPERIGKPQEEIPLDVKQSPKLTEEQRKALDIARSVRSESTLGPRAATELVREKLKEENLLEEYENLKTQSSMVNNPQNLELIKTRLDTIKDPEIRNLYTEQIDKAMNANKQERAAIIYSLYQQPGFRQLLNDKGIDEQ